jgi:hypothetical protein
MGRRRFGGAYHYLMCEHELQDRGYEAGGTYVVVLFYFLVSIAVALDHLVRIWVACLALYIDEGFACVLEL